MWGTHVSDTIFVEQIFVWLTVISCQEDSMFPYLRMTTLCNNIEYFINQIFSLFLFSSTKGRNCSAQLKGERLTLLVCNLIRHLKDEKRKYWVKKCPINKYQIVPKKCPSKKIRIFWPRTLPPKNDTLETK